VGHLTGPVLRLDQLPFAGKARELELLNVSPTRPLDRDREAHRSDDRRGSVGKDREWIRSVVDKLALAVRSQPETKGDRMAFIYRLELEDRTPADPPSYRTAVPDGNPGDTKLYQMDSQATAVRAAAQLSVPSPPSSEFSRTGVQPPSS
jgi:hypothetical protein